MSAHNFLAVMHRYQMARMRAVVIAAALFGTTQAIAQTSIDEGRTLAFDRFGANCLSCHAMKGGELAGTIGPALGHIKTRFPDRKELYAIIYDETKRNPQTVMPPFGRNLILTEKQINEIIDFLYTL